MAWQPTYATKAEYKVRNQDGTGATTDDVLIDGCLAAASRVVDAVCHRQFGNTEAGTVRYYPAEWVPSSSGFRHWRVRSEDFTALTAAALDLDGDETFGYALTVADLVKLPRNASADGYPWVELTLPSGSTYYPTRAHPIVKLTGTWGWSAVPATVKEATLLQAARFVWRRDAPAGVAGSPEVGSEVRLLAVADPDVRVMLNRYVKRWGAR